MSDIRQYLPSVAKPTEQDQFTNALYDALDEAINHIENMESWAQDQFFLTTADPQYLFNLGSRNGFFLPRGSGLNVDGYRPLAPIMIYRPKTVLETLFQILEIYFSPTLVRPNMVSAVQEPYSLQDGDDLIVRTRRGDSVISIDNTAFSDINNISASELASYINFSQDFYIADVFLDRSTGRNFVRLTSNGYGPGEIIQIIGGTLQNIMQFPNVIPTTNTTGTRWTITKENSYTDEVRFTYQAGPLANVYEVEIGDYVTMRNFFNVGGTGLITVPVLDQFGNQIIDSFGNPVVITINLTEGNYDVLNGSYQVIDVGYDYFVVRNKSFLTAPFDTLTVTGEWQELSPNDIVFTKNFAHRITDMNQFAIINEAQSNNDTLTVTVPAVPPIVKRYLQGAWHIYGLKVPVTDFNRNTVLFDMSNLSQEVPVGAPFVLGATSSSYNFIQKFYKTVSAVGNSYNVDLTDNQSIFPYTQSTNVSNPDPFEADFDSDLITMTFGYRHGLKEGLEVTIANAAPNLFLDPNGSYIVESVPAENQIIYRANTKNTGQISASSATLVAINRTSFYLQFPSPATVVSAGLEVGKKFALYDDGTVTYNNYPMFLAMLNTAFVPTSISGSTVYFSVNFPLPEFSGTVASGVKTRTAVTVWGGNTTTYLFNKTSIINQERFMNGLNAVIYQSIQHPNPFFLGSYAYDPSGQYYRYLPGRIGSKQTNSVLKGESGVIVQLQSSAGFPQSGGYVVFDYGTTEVEGPVRYLSVNAGQMVIDPAYVFKNTHDIGSSVRQTPITQAYTPKLNGNDYQPFITGTTTARDTVFDLIEKVVSAGVFVEQDILLPDLRYDDDSLNPYL